VIFVNPCRSNGTAEIRLVRLAFSHFSFGPAHQEWVRSLTSPFLLWHLAYTRHLPRQVQDLLSYQLSHTPPLRAAKAVLLATDLLEAQQTGETIHDLDTLVL